MDPILITAAILTALPLAVFALLGWLWKPEAELDEHDVTVGRRK